ncbi:hypothetical protein T11_8548 [Trichinella zimbabwensis]|uniref:Uncharacterized protein n=1 Tax=Trichinella zimbabwensis TaxID=268475 RepID=A0A0V1HNS4_9BILA|nr:hypothetical protein T11_8548 [Trichinella zimbabwensis]
MQKILFDCDDLLDQPCNGSVVLSKDVNKSKKVGLNAIRRTAYAEQFDIFEGKFGMSLIQLKHKECRKLVINFVKFDKTLKSLLVYRKKNSGYDIWAVEGF